LDQQKTPQAAEAENTARIEVQEAFNPKCVVIIDAISDPTAFRKSANIKKEIKQYCSGGEEDGEIEITYAYSLTRGGVAIHTRHCEQAQRIIERLPVEAFGGGKKYLLSNKTETVFLKDVDPCIAEDTLKEHIENQGIRTTKVTRIRNFKSGRPTPVVKVLLPAALTDQLLTTKLVINRVTCRIERRRLEVVRCYNCQSLGHIAAFCRLPRNCVNCAKQHSDRKEKCKEDPTCHNCEGEHKASNQDCPKIQRHIITLVNRDSGSDEDFASKHKECQHEHGTAKTGGEPSQC
jgi:hypothetical protein